MINYLDNYLTGPSSNHLKRKKWFRLPANILRTKPNCLPASQTIEIKTRQRKAKVPPGTCPYFNWCESFTEHTPPPEVRVPGQVPSLWLCHCADSSNDCHFFPLLLPAAPEAHQPVFWSQEFIVNLATSHAIVMQLVRLTPAGPLPSTLRAPKDVNHHAKFKGLPARQQGSGCPCTLSFLLPPLGSSSFQQHKGGSSVMPFQALGLKLPGPAISKSTLERNRTQPTSPDCVCLQMKL